MNNTYSDIYLANATYCNRKINLYLLKKVAIIKETEAVKEMMSVGIYEYF